VVDGLYDEQILESLRPREGESRAEDPAHFIVDEALARAGRDNTTAVVVEVV
jgi:serine/threonine protein phosphatase PrpC